MFEWLKRFASPSETGLAKMTHDLERMIHEGRHAFDAACSVLLDGAAADAVRGDLLATDGRIDALEQSIRRQILVHGSVHGAVHLPELMVLMSVAKDAERIGDYAKNLFAISPHHTVPPGTRHHEQLQSLRRATSQLLADAPGVYEGQDRARAEAFIATAQTSIDECEQRIEAVFQAETSSGLDAACMLAYRHIRRVAGHVQNIVSAVVNPVDMIDFSDEPKVP